MDFGTQGASGYQGTTVLSLFCGGEDGSLVGAGRGVSSSVLKGEKTGLEGRWPGLVLSSVT